MQFLFQQSTVKNSTTWTCPDVVVYPSRSRNIFISCNNSPSSASCTLHNRALLPPTPVCLSGSAYEPRSSLHPYNTGSLSALWLCQGPQIQGLFGSLMNNSERHYPSGFGIFMTIFGQRVDPNRPEVVVTSHQQTSETIGRKWRSQFCVSAQLIVFFVFFFLLTSSHRGRWFLSCLIFI